MSKMICTNCDSVFEEEDCTYFWEEYHDEVRSSEHFAGNRCPVCGAEGEYLKEAVMCERCHFEKDPDELIGGILCKECFQWAVKIHPEWVMDFLEENDICGEFAEFVAERI